MLDRLIAWFSARATGNGVPAPSAGEFERLSLIAKHTGNAVNILDRQGRIEWVNDGFTRITGFSFQEARGKVPGSFLRCDLSDPTAAAEIDLAVQQGRGIRRELLNRSKDGRTYWLDIEIQPLLDEHGTHTGFMAIETDISEAKALQQALIERNADLENMSQLAGVGAWRMDLLQRRLWWSQQLHTIHEVDEEFEPTLDNYLSFYDLGPRQQLEGLVKSTLAGGAPWDVELPLVTGKGREIWVRALGRPVTVHGQVVGIAGAFQDITGTVATRAALKGVQERLELATRGANIGLWDWHCSDARTWISENWWEHLGYTRQTKPDALSADPLHEDDAARVGASWTEFVSGKAERFLCEFRLMDAAGDWRWVQSNGRATKYDPAGGVERASGVFMDVHQRKLADEQRIRDQEHLWSLANVDGLTKLPNRALFFSDLEAAILRAGRKGRDVVVGVLDLDRFKEVNDSFGHAIGDEFLIKIAQRLQDSMRAGEVVARLSGDEFAFFLTDIPEGRREARLEEILAAICRPVELSNLARRSGGSLGYAVFPQDASTSAELLRRADIALYAAKGAGRRTCRAFRREMEEEVIRGRDVRHEFETALEKGEIVAFYQPVLSADEKSISGFEALARWRHPTKGVVGPSHFSSALLEPELAQLLGRRMRQLVIDQIGAWRRAGLPFGRVAMNVVAADFTDGALAVELISAIREGMIRGSELCIEITEGVLLDGAGNGRIREDLFALRSVGVEIALDDFGTGFASLSHLREYPIDRLKIDRSFVVNLPGSERDLEIVRTIGALAGALGLRLTAEGVETRDQAGLVRNLGATDLQGFLFGKAMHPDRVKGFVARRSSESPSPVSNITPIRSRRGR